MWAVPLVLAPPLGSQDAYCYACQGQLVLAHRNVYAVGPDALPCTWLAHVPALWRSAPVPYGPLWIVLSGAAAGVAGSSLLVAVLALRVIAVAATVLAVAAGMALARRCGGRPVTVAWVGALSPLVLVHDISGAHNDAVLAALVVAGLAVAAGRRVPGARWIEGPAARVAVAGVVFGLAAAVKVTAVVAAPFAVPVALAASSLVGAGHRGRRVVGLGAVLAGALAATYAGLALVTGYGLGFVHALTRTGSMVQWLSLPSGIGMAAGYLMRAAGWPQAFDTAVAVPRVVGLVVLAAVLVLLWRRALEHAKVGAPTGVAAAVTAAGVALLVTVVLGPVVYAWYAVPGLCVLATVPWSGPGRIAVTVAAAGLIVLTLPDGLGLATKTKGPGAVLDVLVALCGVVWWLRRRRQRVALR
jgi:hypothetical protein